MFDAFDHLGAEGDVRLGTFRAGVEGHAGQAVRWRFGQAHVARDDGLEDLVAEVLFELLNPGEIITIAKGGDGGFGNLRFKSAINRAPRQKTPGWPGEKKNLKLELKVLADVGLLGMPNAGKSTFITAVSNARPKIADYPFTTLHPNLGVVRVGPEQSFVVADIPGLIEGASEGAGLGHQFLRHVEQARVLPACNWRFESVYWDELLPSSPAA